MSEEKLSPTDLTPAHSKSRVWIRMGATVLALIVVVCFIVSGIAAVYTKMYDGKVYPGVYVGNYPLGGLTGEQVKNIIEAANNRYAKEGFTFEFKDTHGQSQKVSVSSVVRTDSSGDLLHLESDTVAELALSAGRSGTRFQKLWQPLALKFIKSLHLKAPIAANDPQLKDTLVSALSGYEDSPHNATFSNVDLRTGSYTPVPEKSGQNFEYSVVLNSVKEAAGQLSFNPIRIELSTFNPTITVSDVAVAGKKLLSVVGYGNVSVNFIDPATQARHDWSITPKDFAPWLEVEKDVSGVPVITLNQDILAKFLNTSVAPIVNTPPVDAKFVMENGRVQEFQGSQNGLSVDEGKTISDLLTAFRERNYGPVDPLKTITVSVQIVEPKIKTADVNDLGITGIIGVGYSTFKDSHTNRIKNIANAVKRLNGTLIQPNEEFSAIKYAGPFTAENGFLPEQVIKGNEIKPEIGGGMCQIGTTLFRMAMNSGMDITERHNHSLVVGYYADPVNGNPGTDATLYEPILDLKFKNDTGNYLLLQTDIDYKKQQLTFTLWGKPDGRTGSYTHPLVSKWISPGGKDDPPQLIPVDDGSVPVGVTKCQAAFRGAVASFVYTRYTPSGEKIERKFDSYYRPLPKICTVGMEKGSCSGGKTCVIPTSSTPSGVPTASTSTRPSVDAAN